MDGSKSTVLAVEKFFSIDQDDSSLVTSVKARDLWDDDVSGTSYSTKQKPEEEVRAVPVDCTVVDPQKCIPRILRCLSNGCYPKFIKDSLSRCYVDSELMQAIISGRCDLLPALMTPGCQVNQVNRDGHTALDLLIYRLFPVQTGSSHVQLWQKPSPGVVPDWSSDRLPEALRTLFRNGGRGNALGWLILHILAEERLMKEMCYYATDLTSDKLIAKLLLQTSVKYCQEKNFRFLLQQGISLQTFWEPASNRTCFRDVQIITWDKVSTYAKKKKLGALCEHVLDSIKLPINAALLLLRAANSPEILERIVLDLIRPIDPYDAFQTGKAIEIFFPYAILCRTFPETNLLAELDTAGYPLHRMNFEQKKLIELYNLDIAKYFGGRKRGRGVTSLTSLCRKCIRMNLNKNAFYGINRLPLPISLRDFLINGDF